MLNRIKFSTIVGFQIIIIHVSELKSDLKGKCWTYVVLHYMKNCSEYWAPNRRTCTVLRRLDVFPAYSRFGLVLDIYFRVVRGGNHAVVRLMDVNEISSFIVEKTPERNK